MLNIRYFFLGNWLRTGEFNNIHLVLLSWKAIWNNLKLAENVKSTCFSFSTISMLCCVHFVLHVLRICFVPIVWLLCQPRVLWQDCSHPDTLHRRYAADVESWLESIYQCQYQMDLWYMCGHIISQKTKGRRLM